MFNRINKLKKIIKKNRNFARKNNDFSHRLSLSCVKNKVKSTSEKHPKIDRPSKSDESPFQSLVFFSAVRHHKTYCPGKKRYFFFHQLPTEVKWTFSKGEEKIRHWLNFEVLKEINGRVGLDETFTFQMFVIFCSGDLWIVQHSGILQRVFFFPQNWIPTFFSFIFCDIF